MSKTAAAELVLKAAVMAIELGLDPNYWNGGDLMCVAQSARSFLVNWEPAPRAIITLDVNGRSGKLEVDIKIKTKRLTGGDAAVFAKQLDRVAGLAERIEEMAKEAAA